MADITPLMAQAFELELTKLAFPPAGLWGGAKNFLASQGSTIGGMAGMGGMLGAGAGAALGGVKGYREQRQYGATRGRALLGGGLGGIRGGIKGGLLGAAAGGLAGGLGGEEARKLVSDVAGKTKMVQGAEGMVAKPTLMSRASRLGQRQMYGFTGALPAGAGTEIEKARALGAGAAPHLERLQKAEQGVKDLGKPPVPPKAGKTLKELSPTEMAARTRAAVQEHVQASKGAYHAQQMEGLGATSIPGYAKALWHHPLDTLKHGIGEQWHGSGVGGKAMMFGLPAAMATSELARPAKPGESRLGRLGSTVGMSTIGMAPLPMAPMLALGMAGGKAGELAGKGVSSAAKLFKRPQQAGAHVTGYEPGGGQVEYAGGNFTGPVEYNYSNSAKGLPPEGWT